jgi:hypothetical protein
MINENPSDLLEEPGCLHVDSHGGKHNSEIILEEMERYILIRLEDYLQNVTPIT